jgi:hypothetical protein
VVFVTISEKDWKHFKRIRQIALDRYCTAILQEAQEICGSESTSSHERYLKLYSLIQEHNKAMKFPFDGLGRSSATLKLKVMCDMGLVTDEEMQGFSESLRSL